MIKKVSETNRIKKKYRSELSKIRKTSKISKTNEIDNIS